MSNKKTTKQCAVCGKSFEVYKSDAERRRTCSRSCLGVLGGRAKSSSQSGADNPNWKGGVSSDNYRYKKVQKERYPDRVAARDAVRDAIRSGDLVRGPCEVCQTTEDVHAHHDDYSKPLEVRWLCRKHHRELHES